MKTTKYYTNKRYFEGNEGGEGQGQGQGQGTGTGAGAGAGATTKTFTQDQVDQIVQQRLAKEKEAQRTLHNQLRTLEQNANLTAEEKKALQDQIADLEGKFLTKEEQAAKERNRLQEEYNTNTKKLTSERDTWQRRYTDSTIQQALTTASVEFGAENPRQMMMMFQGSSYLQENVGDDGKPNGSFTPRLKFQGIGEDKKSLVELDLPVDQAMKKIKEDGLHKNLFKATGVGGTGPNLDRATGGSSAKTGNMPRPEDFPDNESFRKAYSQWRQEYKLDGSKKKV